MKTYVTLAYRWGSTNDHWYWLYAGPDAVKASAMAQAERDDRGGKYSCAVYETNDTGDEWHLYDYHGTHHGNGEPVHNFNLDMYERLGHVLADYANGSVWAPKADTPNELECVKVEPHPLVVAQFERTSIMYAQMQSANDQARREARERSERISCAFCDAWPVFDVEYSMDVLRVPRDETQGTVIVEGLRGTYCRRCEQLWQRPQDQIGFNQVRIMQARKGIA